MHVKAKQIAFGGLLLAVTVVCMALGSVIETNTLFLCDYICCDGILYSWN